MNTLSVVLIVVGLILALLLTGVVYTLWKYIKARQEKGAFPDDKKVTKRRRKQALFDDVDTFQVPVSYRTVKAQIPFMYEPDGCSGGGSMGVYARRSSDQDKKRLSVDDVYEKRPKAYSLPIGGDSESDRLLASLPEHIYHEAGHVTAFDESQRKISMGMMAHLANQGRKVSTVDMRGLSITEEMFLKSVEGAPSFQGSSHSLNDDALSDSSHLSAKDEIFDSTIIGMERRRIGERRGRQKILGSGSASGPGTLKRTYKKAGKITFTTEYNESTREFEVLVLRAFDLAPRRDKSEINPFVRLYLLPGKKQKQNTKYQTHTKEPFINEKIVFTDLEKTDLSKYRLKIKVYNHGKLKKNEMLGEVDIPMGSIDISSKQTFNTDLFLQRSESSLASLNISLCHKATSSELEVIIQEARNLPKVSIAGLPSPYTTVTLYKEQNFVKKETGTKRSTRDPVFKESLVFEVFTDIATPLSTFSLVATLNHHSMIGRDEVLGHVIFCLTSPQKSAAEHWKRVEETPHKHHSSWHALIDPDEL
ncbi:synaptotagmin-4-like [Hydractinia symbiolongicarpus]|uniref:synaptotagmin-4-like n=1 Tax=Hydractinia symbiolongicarpus TaxID=13093 RepID=UPI00254A61BC|nr:synaptotagmin-4-like [Hydractinia symbiolongicarpus]XP_057293933.1 synaptotagmin-4-like [Hydractinia symbiolongicarpus]XP_057293934.1 synaptotagmin-4-like [Hydractinia symbiolongicarpus]XP_057293935.1 synaptotagmin-4-like [Hydractinia symbiolongicarpus]